MLGDKKKQGMTSDEEMDWDQDIEDQGNAFKGQKGGRTSGNGKDLEDLSEEDADVISDMDMEE